MTFAIAILLAQVGASLAVLGWFGRRVEATPRCRRCEYDLRGIDALTRCPECGASLEGPRAIRRDATRRRPRWIAIGVAMLLLGGTTIGLDRGGLLTERTLDRLTPTSWLLWRVEHDRGATLSASVDRLCDRLAIQPQRFSDEQLRRTLERLVELHGDLKALWRADWCDPIERAFVADALPPALLANYLDALADSVGVTLDRPMLAPGDQIRPSLVWQSAPRVRSGRQAMFFGHVIAPLWGVDCRFVMRLGGVVIEDQSHSETPDGFMIKRPDDASTWRPNWGFIPRVPRDILNRVSPGPQVLEIEMIFDLQDTSRRSLGTLHRASRTFRIPVTLAVPTTEPTE